MGQSSSQVRSTGEAPREYQVRQLFPVQISLLRQFKTQSLLDVFALFFKSYAYVLNFKTPNKGALRLLLERMFLILCMLCREGISGGICAWSQSYLRLHTEHSLVEDVSRPLLALNVIIILETQWVSLLVFTPHLSPWLPVKIPHTRLLVKILIVFRENNYYSHLWTQKGQRKQWQNYFWT